MVRVIGGEARGRKLILPGRGAVRPTSDFVREALFNILGPQDGCLWLDIFAGTGAVGLEALSRGAAKAFFIENSRSCCEAVRANALKCGFEERVEILEMTAAQGLQTLGRRGLHFDRIFADPPYDKGLADPTIIGIEQAGILAGGAMAVIQHSTREPLNVDLNKWELSDKRIYGDTVITILTRI